MRQPGKVITYIDKKLINPNWKRKRIPAYKRKIKKALLQNKPRAHEIKLIKATVNKVMEKVWRFNIFDDKYYIAKLKTIIKQDHPLIIKHRSFYERSIKKFCLERKFRASEVFYKTTAWKKLKNQALDRDNHCCVNCKSKDNLQVHHINYRQISNKLSDLITLCLDCHQKYHKKNKLSR